MSRNTAIATIAVVGLLCDLSILAAGVWLTFILGFSFWWWLFVMLLSWGETIAIYKLVNAVNGELADYDGRS